MFYENQPEEQQNQYKEMLSIMGKLTYLFSESDSPYLAYRAHENIFCKYFEAENLARVDCSADAKKEKIGIGLKTWTGRDDQKIAEFGKLRDQYKNLSGLELIKFIAECRNERIKITKRIYGLEKLIYHIVKRIPNTMQIIEYAFDPINISKIKIINGRGNTNNIYFTDNNHIYHFSLSKNTLYMIFEDIEILEEIKIEIMADPFSFLEKALNNEKFRTVSYQKITDKNFTTEIELLSKVFRKATEKESFHNKICLRLYSSNKKNGKFVAEKSGLNQWNAGGRKRNPDEIYIPYPVEDRRLTEGFFPPRDIEFDLYMPDGAIISAKVCQDEGKAIMSNPNKVLGEWLLRKVFELTEGTVLTYEMLEVFGIDSVIFTKIDELKYKIDFSEIGTYEDYIANIHEEI